jgi:hypothetical protein
MPIVLKTQAFHSQFVFKRRKMMNAKAPCLSVVRTDSASPEADYLQAKVAAAALSDQSEKASDAYSKLLWALVTASSPDRVRDLANQWVEAVAETIPATGADDPHILAESLMHGAQALMWSDPRRPMRRH